MSQIKPYLENAGIKFFSRVSASISHEVKNVLAIMNENAGLLEDSVLMAQRDVPLSHARLEHIAANLRKLVQRADGIIKKMSRFAHDVDMPEETVDLYEAIYLMVDICARMIESKEIGINVIQPEHRITINTNRFYLQNLLWVCTESIMKTMNPGETIRIEIVEFNKGTEVIFSFETMRKEGVEEIQYGKSATLLLSYLDAELIDDAAPRSIYIRWPGKTC